MLAKVGLEIGTYAGSFSEHRLKLLNELGVCTLWDVGAHVGQYARALRDHGYTGRIVSLEPGNDAHARLQRTARDDDRWTVFRIAAGNADEELKLNISANGQSSSILPMLTRHIDAAPNSGYVATETVAVRQLDDMAGELLLPAPCALKLDVQGYELTALGGATRLLKDCVLVEIELTLLPLYKDGADWLQVIESLSQHGFRLCDLERVYYDRGSGDLLQMDGLFRRNP